jgi:neurotransmitter:Na+ symporter, NSS family
MEQNISQNTWQSHAGYVWALIGSAVGFANILSFSAKAYFHGGGAFLIPFTLAIIILGIPLLCLEGIIGQSFGLPLVSAYQKAAGSVGKYFGWLAIFAVTTIGGYYMLLTGWTIAYSYFSIANLIPADTVNFLNTTFLAKTGSIGIWGTLSVFEFACTALVALFAWVIVHQNVQSGIEKTCIIFLPMLTCIIIASAVVVCFLPGAFDGFYYYLTPDFARLLHPRIWLDAFGHIFFSLSLGLGIITGYSRHADKSINIYSSMMWVVIGDTLISFIAGFTIFGCIGYMSRMTGTPFTQIVTSDSPFEMGFVIFPIILKMFGPLMYRIISPLFFFCVFIAGITGVFSIIESTAGNFESEFGMSRRTAVSWSTGIMLCLAGIFCMGNGQYLVGAIDPMVAGFNMLISGIAETIIFMWCFGSIKNHPIWKSSNGNHSFMYYNLRYITPICLSVVFILSLINEINTGLSIEKYIRWGWLGAASVLALLLIYIQKRSRKAF